MVQPQSLLDCHGIIRKVLKTLPETQKLRFLQVLAELEDPECYHEKLFPISKLKRVKGVKLPVYTVDLDSISKWQIYVLYQEGQLILYELHQTPPKAVKSSLDIIAEVNDF